MTYEPVPEPSPWVRVAKVVSVIGLVVVAGVAIVGGGSYLGRWVGSTFSSDDPTGAPSVVPGLDVTVEIPAGSTAKDIGAILAAQGVVRSALEFEVAVRNTEAASRLQAGTYGLETLMDPSEVVAVLVVGPVADTYRVTVIEGLRVSEILTRLSEVSGQPYAEFEQALLEGEVDTSLRQMPAEPDLAEWEGLLFPDTYEFTRSAAPASILQRLASTMEQRVDSIDWSVLEANGYSPYDGLIIASLIETEVLLDEERPTVSSVVHNRLALGMKLDIDATVLYALGTRDISQFDRDVDSPYNTYLVNGLPPTPIAGPGRASLEAAAAPAETEFLFYVLSDLEGHHAFAATLDEHNANVARAREEGVLP
ncbi:MAG TPA: endolytic transglycosylase MltG [Acidimicrobiia bacterium]|nr:endolytic transglycosylase MltG [Acidimicrobiia bacterium]